MGKKTEEVPVLLSGHDRGRRAAVADHRDVQDRGRRPPLLEPPLNYDNKHLREHGTKDYTWALYEGANILEVELARLVPARPAAAGGQAPQPAHSRGRRNGQAGRCVSMARRLEGKTCIITGAAMGIGRAVAVRLAAGGRQRHHR